MKTVMISHEVDDVAHWLSSAKRKEVFGALGMTVRTFVDPTKTNRVGLIVETPDMSVLQKMLESPEAIDEAEAIAAVEHVDVLLIGTSDLCNELGLPGQFGHERIVHAYETVVAACRRHGKHAGMAGIREDGLMRRYIEMGARFVVAATDVPLLIEAGKARTRVLRDIESGLPK